MNKTYKKLLIGLFTGLMAVTVYAVATELSSTSLFSDANLKVLWKLEDTADSKASFTLTNNNSTTFTTGLYNNAGNFNGSNQSLNNNSVLATLSYPRTIMGWFKPASVSGDRGIVCLGDGAVHYYCLKIDSTAGHIAFRSNNNTQAGNIDTGITPNTSTWYCFALVQNSTTNLDFYVGSGGVITSTITGTTTFVATVSQLYLGYLGRSSVWFYSGLIDDVSGFNRALTSTEVGNYCNGSAPSATSPSTLGFFNYYNKRK